MEIRPKYNEGKPISFEFLENDEGKRKIIGQGAFATVYEGICKDDNKLLAIKVFKVRCYTVYDFDFFQVKHTLFEI